MTRRTKSKDIHWCCHAGCPERYLGSRPQDWYVYRPMNYAVCPDHADQWREYGRQMRRYEEQCHKEWLQAFAALKQDWLNQYHAAHQVPESPPIDGASAYDYRRDA